MDRPAIVAQIDALAAQLAALRAAVTSEEPEDEHLTATQCRALGGPGHDGLLAAARRGEIKLTRGPRNQVLVRRSEVAAYMQRPHAPTARRARPTPAADYDDEVRLQLLAGGRR